MSSPPTDPAEVRIRQEVKRELRTRLGAVRGALPRSACEVRSKRITDRVIELPSFARAATVLCFSSVRNEVRTRGIQDAAWRVGKRVALPRVVDEDLSLLEVRPNTELVAGAFGVPEPPRSSDPIEPGDVDLAMIPALAVDPRGYRIGYGGGYYDRLLPRLTKARSCALAFDFQLVAEVPELEFDAPVDIVVTDARVIHVD